MHLFYADETALNTNESDWFIYGGVIIPEKRVWRLHQALAEIKAEVAEKDRPLKWKQADGLTWEERKAHHLACEKYLKVAAQNEVIINFVIIAHAIALAERKRTWRIEHVLGRFQDYLDERRTHGMAFIDTFDEKEDGATIRDLLTQCFMRGTWDGRFHLNWMVGVHESYSGTSHFSGLADVAINALRMVVNQPKPEDVPKWAALLNPLCEKGWKNRIRFGTLDPDSPYEKYRAMYTELLQRLNSHGLVLAHELNRGAPS